MAVVYGLYASDRSNEVRYVGQTVRSAVWRRKRHVEAAHSGRGKKYPVHHWIVAVEGRGASVEVVVLVNEAIWNVDEIEEIRGRRASGARLLNCTDGGDGALNASSETRAKMSASSLGRVKTEEHRRRISESHKRRLLDPALKEALRLRHVGRKRSRATRAKLAGENNPQAKLTAAAVLNMRAEFAEGRAIRDIAFAHGCGYPACYAAVKRLTWQSL